MRMRQHFRTPWDIQVKAVTFGFLALAALGVLTTGEAASLPIVVVAAVVAAFRVRFVGYFRNDIVGRCRAYATDGMRAVLLDFAGWKLVVTSDLPAEFVAAVRAEACLPEPSERRP